VKIIKRKSDDVVLFANNYLTLEGAICSGRGWSYRHTGPVELELEEVAELPEGFIVRGWSHKDGVWTSNAIADQVILPAKRAKKIAQFTAQATTENLANIDYMSHTWRADSASQTLLAQVLAIGSVPEGMYWRDSSGTPRTMGYSDLQGLGLAILTRGLAADNNLMIKTAALNAATTAAEIDAITW